MSKDGRLKVLIVEDCDVVRNFISAYLSAENYHVVTAENIPGALQAIQDNNGTIDAAIIDLVLPKALPPVINGGDIAKIVRESSPRAKIVLTTGFPINDDDPRIQGAALLPKPFTPKDLRTALQ